MMVMRYFEITFAKPSNLTSNADPTIIKNNNYCVPI